MNEILIPEFCLLGIKLPSKTTNEGDQSSQDCGKLWEKFNADGIFDLIPNKLTEEIFAVYFEYDDSSKGNFSYFIGCNIAPPNQKDGDGKAAEVVGELAMPEGLSLLTIPTSGYFKFVVKGKLPDVMRKAWRNISKKKIPRAFRYDFDVYGERSKDWKDAEVEIFISIK